MTGVVMPRETVVDIDAVETYLEQVSKLSGGG